MSESLPWQGVAKEERRVLLYASDGLSGRLPGRGSRSVDSLRGLVKPRNLGPIPSLVLREEWELSGINRRMRHRATLGPTLRATLAAHHLIDGVLNLALELFHSLV